MKLTKIKRKELKRGDMFCEITAMADRPVMTVFKDGSDPLFDQSVFEKEVHRIDMPDYTHELTQFSWKLKQLDDKVEAITTRDKRNGALVETMSKQDAHIKGLKTKIDAHDEEPAIRLEECRHAKRSLQGIVDTLESEVEKLRMKIFDIEGREDLVTAELEHQIKRLEEQSLEKDEIIRQWRNNWCPAMCAKMQKTIGELISDKTILQDTIQKMIVDEQTKRDNASRYIAELEERHNIDIQAWSKRESELLQMVETRDNDLKMLDVMLKIINPIIKSGEFVNIESTRFLSMEMFKLCRDVNAFRREHNICG